MTAQDGCRTCPWLETTWRGLCQACELWHGARRLEKAGLLAAAKRLYGQVRRLRQARAGWTA